MIKYKVFDLIDSKYVDCETTHVSISSDGKLTVGDSYSEYPSPTSRYVVQESFDITDSKGTTIYEGDILKPTTPLMGRYHAVGDFIATIRSGSMSFVTEYKVTQESKQETMDLTPRVFADKCEVIGNVLLEVSQTTTAGEAQSQVIP